MQRQHGTKYTSRPSPPYSAADGEEGMRKRGNDGFMYIITSDKNGVQKWSRVVARAQSPRATARGSPKAATRGTADAVQGRQSLCAAPKPMLATPYTAEPEFPMYAQPKLDGYRMLYDSRTKKAWSRTGQELAVPHIVQQLKAIECAGCVLDGELYKHGHRFQDIQRMVNAGSTDLQFHVFDLIPAAGTDADQPFKERYGALRDMVESTPAAQRKHVRLVPTKLVRSAAQVSLMHDKLGAGGFEGLVLRTPGSSYVPRRSKHLIKVKRFSDAEFKVTGFKSRKDGVGIVWQCETRGGATFWVNDYNGPDPESADAQRALGRHLTVQFQDTFHTGIPRFPTAKGFRDATDFRVPR